ncbi:MAG: right-handed parallel beta-helix repeat-containing protein, partial [Verrucomicrobiota bacterium]
VRAFRLDPTQFTEGATVWFSFFLQLGNAPVGNLNIGFSTSTDTATGIGVTITPEAGGSLRARVSGVLSTQSRALGLVDSFDPASRYFVVGCFERVAGGTDRLRVWLNPEASALESGVLPEADLSVDAELIGFPTTFRTNNIGRANSGGSGVSVGYRIDELRLATTLESARLGETVAKEVALTAPPPPADGVRYYVSAITGNDLNPGTAELPFRTIGRISPYLQPGQICVVHEGVYREVLRPANSGTAEQPITYLAAPGENVVVTGLDVVSGWVPESGGTWRALWPSTLTALRTQVFFDGLIGHQGRWPNRTNDNLMAPQGAPMSSGSDVTKIVAASMPAGLPSDYFDGGTVWAIAGVKWSSWRSPVTGFSPATKAISFQAFTAGSWPDTNHKPAAGGGNVFYVSGGRKLVDAEREWFYDNVSSELVIMPPAGFDPATSVVELQTRLEAIDLSGRSHVTVKGFKVVGSAVNLQGEAQHCTVEDITINYPTAVRNAQGTNWAAGRGGVMVKGSFNTVRECTIAWSWDNGILISGTGNRVINNLVTDANALGTYSAGIYLDDKSRETVVAWNTLRRTGRDGIIANGRSNRYVHNDISYFSSICDDGGGTYSAGQGVDGVIAYNWVHDAAVNSGMKAGIYLDNYTTGVVVHHNVVWNIPWVGIVLNRPSSYHVVAHNTVFGKISNWTSGGWINPRNTSVGTRVANNLIRDALEATSFGATSTTNLADVADMGFDTTTATVTSSRPGLAAGTRIPGISPVAEGVAPDIGAYQTGVDYPRPGHDFSKRPETWFDEPLSPIVQRIDNNIFMDGLKGWTPGPIGTAAVIIGPGFNENGGPLGRNSVYAESLSLTGGASVEQVVTDLVPGTVYSFHAFRKASAVNTAGLSVIFPDGREYRFTFDPNAERLNWQLSDYFEFTVPAGQTEARIGLWMTGPGTVYFDNVGLMQKWWSPITLDYRPTRFTADPQDISTTAGASAAFTAVSGGQSTRTNRWEWRPSGSVDWLSLTSSTGVAVNSARDNPSVTLNPLRPEFHGALFRAATSNYTSAIDNNVFGYHAYSAPARMTVTGVSLDRDSGRIGTDGSGYVVAVTLPAGVPWTVDGLPSWVSASATSGSGPGVVTLVVEPNTSGEKREAVVRIAGREHLVRQSDGEIFAEWVESAEVTQREPTSSPAGDR